MNGPNIDSLSTQSSAGTSTVVNWSGRQARVLIGESNSQWRSAVCMQLENLIRLKDGWDGYRGKAVRLEVANFALRLLDVVCAPNALAPQIVPGVDGDIQIEWHTDAAQIELRVFGPNKVSAWRLTPDSAPDGEEFELRVDFLIVSNWIKELTEGDSASKRAAA